MTTGAIAAIETPGPDEPEVEAANAGIPMPQPTIPEETRERSQAFAEPALPLGNNADGSSLVGDTFQSLSESLDDDAISFITSMKYN